MYKEMTDFYFIVDKFAFDVFENNGCYNVLIADTETLEERALFTKDLEFISSNVSDVKVTQMKEVLVKNQTLLQGRIKVLNEKHSITPSHSGVILDA